MWSVAGGSLAAIALWLACPPPLEEAGRYPMGVILRDREGRVLRVGLGPGDVDCRPCYRTSSEDWIVKAVIAAEDKRFAEHGGVDLGALARASWQNITSGRRLSGASTITMQTVRLIHPHRRTLFWKLVESVQALRLERALGKDEILSQYLNRAPFASNLVGIEAAAQGWFGKSPQQMNLAEASLLAGLLQSPTRFRPDRYPEAARKRRAYVLGRMVALGMIGEAQREDAERAPLVLRRAPRPFESPHFCDWAQRSLGRPAGDFTTTLDPALQAALGELVARQAEAEACDAAAVVVEVRSGAVRAMCCSGDYFSAPDGQVNTTAMPRPAGSTLKPFAYALAADAGQLTPGWVLADVPRRFGEEAPLDFSGSFMGLVTARDALVLSLNLPAIEVEARVGQPRFYAALRELGFEALYRPAPHYGLGLVLGNGPVRLVELANAYACLARGGVWQSCRAFEGTEETGAPERRVFSAGACWLIAEMLGGDERARDAVGHGAEAALPRFAWKTGTSSGFRDAWTVAWNPEYAVGVWCGFKSGRRGPETLVGKRVAAPLAWAVVRRLYPAGGAPWFERPPEVVEREVCAVSGRVPGPLCGRRVTDFALSRCSLCAVCPVHARDAAGAVVERWPPEVAEYLRLRGDAAGDVAGPLRILVPAEGAVFRLVDGMAAQAVAFSVAGAAPGEPLYWFRNDAPEGEGRGGAVFLWKPQRGTHRFVCATASGASAAVTIRVE